MTVPRQLSRFVILEMRWRYGHDQLRRSSRAIYIPFSHAGGWITALLYSMSLAVADLNCHCFLGFKNAQDCWTQNPDSHGRSTSKAVCERLDVHTALITAPWWTLRLTGMLCLYRVRCALYVCRPSFSLPLYSPSGVVLCHRLESKGPGDHCISYWIPVEALYLPDVFSRLLTS